LVAVIAVILIVLVATFLVVYEDHIVAVNANEAVIYYSMSSTSFFYNTTGTQNYITVYYANSGKSIGDFDLTIKFVNATFSTTTGQPYTKINAASAEFGLDLNAGDSTSKDVYFSINSNVNSFSITLSIHSNQASLKTVAEYPDFLQYTWNVNDFKLASK
jgi:hypothetical protein